MPKLEAILELSRCPHCSIDNPNLAQNKKLATTNHAGGNQRYWRIYVCQRCGGAVIAAAYSKNGEVSEVHPQTREIPDPIPSPARDYLKQAKDSRHAPAGAVMLAASSVDAMLKAQGYSEGSLYSRIDQAVEEGLITSEMGRWAHDVRLDANEPRHADEDAPLPTPKAAAKAVDFAEALGEFLFVLPARVQRGIKEAEEDG